MLRGKDSKPGDKVKFLNEKGEGVVSKVTTEYVYVIANDGFELPMLHSEVIVIDRPERKDEVEAEMSVPFEDKKENIIKSEVEIHQKKLDNSIYSNNKSMAKGFYLAFSPIDQNFLLMGDIRIYFINYSKYKGSFNLFFSNDNKYKFYYKGEVEEGTAVLLDSIDRSEIENFKFGVFQFMFNSVSDKGIPAPFYSTFEIKNKRFLDESMYISNSAISMKAVTVQFMRVEEIKFISSFSKYKDDSTENSTLEVKSKQIKEEALIKKYLTSNQEAEVDLHIEKLVENVSLVPSNKRLKLQIDFAKECMDSAIENSFRKIVFIHGVGVGVLKMEINKMLSTYDNIEYRDAPISKYGIGATEVIIFYK